MTRHEEDLKNLLHNSQHPSSSRLTLTLPAADLSTETGLDSGDGTTGTTGVAGNEVKTVFTLVELGVGAAAGLAGNVLD